MNIVILKTTTDFKTNKRNFTAMEKLGYNFVGFVALGKFGGIAEIDGYTVYPIEYIHRLKYDIVFIDCYVENVEQFLPAILQFNVPLDKLRTSQWLLQQMMILKYSHIEDPVIQETLKYWEDH